MLSWVSNDCKGKGSSTFGPTMTTQNLTEPAKIGTVVRIRDSGCGLANIVEFRGPLGPHDARIYPVCVPERPRQVFIEVREDQL
jgi:hypothetical protein